jgi:UrcA family protein
MRHTLLLAIAAAAVIAPSASIAQDSAPSVRVAYHDLNLATEIGRARFDRRIAAAAKRVCPTADVRDIAALLASKTCVAETYAKTQPAIASAAKAQAVALAATPSVALTAQ